DDELRTRATLTLLSSIMNAPFYDSLRTEQQLGYIVNTSTLPIFDISGLVFYIQSPVANPLLLEERIQAFLHDYAAVLDAMTEFAFDGAKQGVLTNLRQPPRRLEALSGRYWSDILIQEYERDSTLAMADAIESLTVEDLRRYYHAYVENRTGYVVARSPGRNAVEDFLAEREEAADVVVLEENSPEYEAFKAQSEQYEFGN